MVKWGQRAMLSVKSPGIKKLFLKHIRITNVVAFDAY